MISPEGGPDMKPRRPATPEEIHEAKVTWSTGALSAMGRRGAEAKARNKREKEAAAAKAAEVTTDAPPVVPEPTEKKWEWSTPKQQREREAGSMMAQYSDPDKDK